MKRLTIGVTEPSHFTQDCVSAIEMFYEANPIKLCANREDNLKACLDMCDGVILAGGVDIHPAIYGDSVKNGSGYVKFDLDRDVRELSIIDKCIEQKKPILGICRGHQMLGVYHGLRIVSDLGNSPICHQPRSQQIHLEKNHPAHAVVLTEKGSRDARFKFPETNYKKPKADGNQKRIMVNSFHHQAVLCDQAAEEAVDVIGTAIGNSVKGVEETIVEIMAGQGWISCQWHPEFDWEVNSASEVMLSVFRDMLKRR